MAIPIGQRSIWVTAVLAILGIAVWAVGAFTGADTSEPMTLLGVLGGAFGVRGVGEHIGRGLAGERDG